MMTEWDSLKSLDLALLRRVMRTPVMVDLRNVYPPDDLERHGFTSVGLGTASRAGNRGRGAPYASPAGFAGTRPDRFTERQAPPTPIETVSESARCSS
jgi:UDPglucose 6-dehydrogenase